MITILIHICNKKLPGLSKTVADQGSVNVAPVTPGQRQCGQAVLA